MGEDLRRGERHRQLEALFETRAQPLREPARLFSRALDPRVRVVVREAEHEQPVVRARRGDGVGVQTAVTGGADEHAIVLESAA
jgi:hypothetical protein